MMVSMRVSSLASNPHEFEAIETPSSWKRLNNSNWSNSPSKSRPPLPTSPTTRRDFGAIPLYNINPESLMYDSPFMIPAQCVPWPLGPSFSTAKL